MEATVIKDCTGVYLRIDSVDYKVCNVEKTENIIDEQKIQATFKNCRNPNESRSICMLYHPFESYIKLCEIK